MPHLSAVLRRLAVGVDVCLAANEEFFQRQAEEERKEREEIEQKISFLLESLSLPGQKFKRFAEQFCNKYSHTIPTPITIKSPANPQIFRSLAEDLACMAAGEQRKNYCTVCDRIRDKSRKKLIRTTRPNTKDTICITTDSDSNITAAALIRIQDETLANVTAVRMISEAEGRVFLWCVERGLDSLKIQGVFGLSSVILKADQFDFVRCVLESEEDIKQLLSLICTGNATVRSVDRPTYFQKVRISRKARQLNLHNPPLWSTATHSWPDDAVVFAVHPKEEQEFYVCKFNETAHGLSFVFNTRETQYP